MLNLDSSEAVEKAINERKAVDKEFEERVNKVAEEIRELYQEQANMFTEQETKDFLYKTELVAGLLETDIAYDMAIDLLENKPSVFRKIYNFINEKYQIKKASSIEAKAELKYYSELRKAYQKALNHKGGMVDLRLLDYQYFADRLEQNEIGIFYKHAGGQLEQVFVFNDGQMLDEIMLNEMYKALYSERVNTQIKQEQQKAQTLIELARINNKYRILDIEKDIVFGKFDIEQNKIISLDEYNVRYSLERNDELKLIKESFPLEQSQIVDDNGELIKENINPKLIKAVEEYKAKIDVINEEHYVPFLTTLEQELNKNIADGDVKFSVANTEFNVKSVGSILSKLYRKNIINNDDYTISQSKDLLRSYITFRGEQYNKADVEIIFNALDKLITETFEKNGKQVKFSVEGMNVPYSGYRAIHLTFMIGGVMTEMQLHTDASWQIKMEQENLCKMEKFR